MLKSLFKTARGMLVLSICFRIFNVVYEFQKTNRTIRTFVSWFIVLILSYFTGVFVDHLFLRYRIRKLSKSITKEIKRSI